MAVIRLPIEPRGSNASITWELRSNTAAFVSPITGATRTIGRSGSRWAATFRYQDLLESYRAIMESFISACRGREQRFYTRDYAYTQRGSFSAPELFTNNDFASGTTGWTAGTDASIYAADGILRATATRPSSAWQVTQSVSGLVPYAPYAARVLLQDGQSSEGLSLGQPLQDGAGGFYLDYSTSRGLRTNHGAAVSASAATQYAFDSNSASGYMAGTYVLLSSCSLARCALVDNGPNMISKSDELDDAAWTKITATATANATAAPDGTTTADALVEDATPATVHGAQQATVTVPSAAADFCIACAFKPAGRSWVRLGFEENTGNFDAYAYFDVTNGTIGTVTAEDSPTSWANPRAFIQSLGNGWWYCALVARKMSAATTLRPRFFAGEANNDITFDGNSTAALYMWRATMAQSSVPTRLVQTTTAATTGTSQTGGALYMKGLPVSTNGLLLANDQIEIITPNGTELKRLRAPLNSDAAGLGYAEIEPVIRDSPADNAAVIIQKPMCRMLLDADSVQWTNHRPGLCDLEFTAVEDITP